MVEVELVIKIPKKIYKSICDKNALGCDVSDIKNIIRNGTPLPNGHESKADSINKGVRTEEIYKEDNDDYER